MSFTGCHRCFKSRCHISFQNNKAAADVPATFQRLFLYSPAKACTNFQSGIRESEAARVYAPPRIPLHQQICRSVRALQKTAPREPAPPCMPPRRRRGLQRRVTPKYSLTQNRSVCYSVHMGVKIYAIGQETNQPDGSG